MSAQREKTSNMMGIVVSVLLHGIFFAGCIAIDYTKPTDPDQTEIHQLTDQAVEESPKS